MSFKCDYCDKPQIDGTKPNKVITKTRNVTYKSKEGKISTGTEIVKEVNLCNNCGT